MDEESVASKVPALERALQILDLLAAEGSMPALEIAKRLNISRSTTYRLVERLRAAGYATDSDDFPGEVTPGPSAARLALAAVYSRDVASVAPRFLNTLVQQTRESVALGVVRDEDIVFIYRDRGPQQVVVNADVGARRPVHCTAVGKAYLAALDPQRRANVLSRVGYRKFTEHTMINRVELEKDITATIARGWSEDHMEFDNLSVCCGAPILDHRGDVVAAISVSGVASRVLPRLTTLGPVVASTGEAISRGLGYDPANRLQDHTGTGDRLDYWRSH